MLGTVCVQYLKALQTSQAKFMIKAFKSPFTHEMCTLLLINKRQYGINLCVFLSVVSFPSKCRESFHQISVKLAQVFPSTPFMQILEVDGIIKSYRQTSSGEKNICFMY